MYSDETIEWNGELWTRKHVEYYYSNHIYAHSAFETANSCGNCDGGECDGCTEVWEVNVMRLPENDDEKRLCDLIRRPICNWERFYNKEEAMEYFENV